MQKDFSIVKNYDALGIPGNELHIVSNEENGAAIIIKALHDIEHFDAIPIILPRRRLIDNQNAWIHGQHGCYRQPLSLALAELFGADVTILQKTDGRQCFLDPLRYLRLLKIQIVGSERNFGLHCFAKNLVVRILKDISHISGQF